MVTDTKDATGKMVPAVEVVGGEVAAFSEPLEGGLVGLWDSAGGSRDNFDGTPLERFQRRMLCNSDALKGGDHLNETIAIRYWMVHSIQLVKEDGEVVDTYRTVFITPDGTAYAFVSGVIAKAVVGICNFFGSEPIDPPLEVQIKQKNLANSKRCYVVVPVNVPQQSPKKK